MVKKKFISSRPPLLGIVDVGTNSVRFAIYRLSSRLPQAVFKRKMMLRPGQGVFETGKLKPATIKKLKAAFSQFARRCRKNRVTIVRAVATSALREARNAKQVIRSIQRKTGIRIEVISGLREAGLIAKGILHYDPPRSTRSLLIDIGGGSTEITLCVAGRARRSLSLELGALRLSQLFLPAENAADLESRLLGIIQMRRFIQRTLKQRLTGWKPIPMAIGSSGTIRAVARLIDATHPKRAWPPRRRSGRLRIKQSELRHLVEQMVPLSRAQLARLPGMEKRRLDIILSGSILLFEIADHLEIKVVRTTNFALRDGLVLEAAEFSRRKKL